MTLVLWVDLQCRHEEAQCQDRGAGALIVGSARCKKALQDNGPPAEHCCPPDFTLQELLSPAFLYAITPQSHQQSVLNPEGCLVLEKPIEWDACASLNFLFLIPHYKV